MYPRILYRSHRTHLSTVVGKKGHAIMYHSIQIPTSNHDPDCPELLVRRSCQICTSCVLGYLRTRRRLTDGTSTYTIKKGLRSLQRSLKKLEASDVRSLKLEDLSEHEQYTSSSYDVLSSSEQSTYEYAYTSFCCTSYTHARYVPVQDSSYAYNKGFVPKMWAI